MSKKHIGIEKKISVKNPKNDATSSKGRPGKNLIAILVIAVVIGILVIAGYVVVSYKTPPPQTTVNVENGNIKIPLQEVIDGKIHFYYYKGVRFFVIYNTSSSIITRMAYCKGCDNFCLSDPNAGGYSLLDNGTKLYCSSCRVGWYLSDGTGFTNGTNVSYACLPAPPVKLDNWYDGTTGFIYIRASDVAPP